MDVDPEIIIMEVEKYPVLYNPDSDNYKNRSAKTEAWKKVTEATVGELYQTLDDKQQNEIGKEIQKKWKTMKDTYLRSLKTQQLKSGSGAAKRKPYVYHQQMSFLLPTIENRRTAGSEEGNDDDDEQDPGVAAVMPRVPRVKKKERFEAQLINLLKSESTNQAQMPSQDNDADKLFLLSLLPKMKALNPSASLAFQIEVMQLLQTYLSDSKNLVNEPHVSQPSGHHAVRNLPSTSQGPMHPSLP